MKRQKYKQILAILMAIAMGCTSIPTTAFASEVTVNPVAVEETNAVVEEQPSEDVSSADEQTAVSTEAASEEAVSDEQENPAPIKVEEEVDSAKQDAASEPAKQDNKQEEAAVAVSEETSEEETSEEPPADETLDLVYDTSWYNEQDTEFTLTDAFDLVGLAVLVKEKTDDFTGKTIKLGNDINAGGVKWVPIGYGDYISGTRRNPFKGTFDGQGYTITNVLVKPTSANPNEYMGIFGCMGENAVIQNLHVTDAEVWGSDQAVNNSTYIGGLVGMAVSDKNSIIRDCSFEGLVTTRGQYPAIGGLVGFNGTVVESCTFKGTVRNDYGSLSNQVVQTGGIVGIGGTVISCTVEEGSTIQAKTGYVGGIIGTSNSGTSVVRNCVNHGEILLTQDANNNKMGGIVGYATAGTLDGNLNTGKVLCKAASAKIGGIIGDANAAVKVNYCVNTGTLQYLDQGTIYGIAGNGILNTCYSTSGAIEGASVNNCYTAETDDAAEVEGVTYLKKNAYTNGILLNGLNNNAPIWEENEDGYPMLKKTALLGISIAPTGLNAKTNLVYDPAQDAYLATIPGVDFTALGEENFDLNLLRSDVKTKVRAASETGDSWKIIVTYGDQSDTYLVNLAKTLDLSWYDPDKTDFYLDTPEKLAGFTYLGFTEGKVFKGQTIHLTADIDMEGFYWYPIGSGYNAPFTGNFDGGNHTIKNLTLYVEANSGEYAMFSQATSSEIKNFTIENFHGYMKAQYGRFTGLCYRMNTCTVENVSILNASFEVERVGTSSSALQVDAGISRNVYSSTIRNCRISGEVPAHGMFYYVGSDSVLENCVNEANCTAADAVAGIAYEAHGLVKNCVNKGNITSTNNAAYGICGVLEGVMESCRNEGDVVAGKGNAAGLVGATAYSSNNTAFAIRNSINTGDVTASASGYTAAGVITENTRYNGTLINCSNTGAITADAENGTAVGLAAAGNSYQFDLYGCRNTGTLTGKNVYGLTKGTKNTIENSYSVAMGTLDAASYDCVFVQKADEETELPEGVTTFEASEVADGTLAAKLNENSIIFWNQKTAPEQSAASILEASLTVAGYKAPFMLNWDEKALHVQLTEVDTSQFTAEDFNLTCVDSDAAAAYRYEDGEGILTITAGEDTVEYRVVFDILPDSSWYDAEKAEFTITTTAQLQALAVMVNDMGITMEGKTIKLGADLDFSGVTNWQAIGANAVGFKGTFDGCGHKITNWTETRTSYYQMQAIEVTDTVYGKTYVMPGLFGFVDGGAIKNLSLEQTNLTFETEDAALKNSSGYYTYYAGAVVSYLHQGIVDNVTVNGTITSNGFTGGIVGRLAGTVSNCVNEANVTGEYYAGGVVGRMLNGQVLNSTNRGAVSSTCSRSYGTGGVIGSVYDDVRNADDYAKEVLIKGCRNEGAVLSNSSNAGGILGYFYSYSGAVRYPYFVDCGNTGSVQAKNGVAAGILGDADASFTMDFCWNKGKIEASSVAAGLCSCDNAYSCIFNHCFNQGLIKGGSGDEGGIAGYSYAIQFNHCYSFYYDAEADKLVDGKLCGGTISDNTFVNSYYYNANTETDVVNPNGLTQISKASNLADGTLAAQMNKQWSAWKQGQKGPELSDALVASIAVVKDGKTFNAAVSNGTIRVQMPMIDLTSLTSENFQIVTKDAATKVTYAYNADKKCWTMTASNGADTNVYELYFDFLETGWYSAEKDSFTIQTTGELLGLVYLVNQDGNTFEGKTITLDADLDMSSIAWEGIGVFSPSAAGGTITTSFKGIFDGKNHTISNLAGSAPLFQVVENGTVKNLQLKDAAIEVTSGNYQAAALVNYVLNSTLEQIKVTGTLTTARQRSAMLAAYAMNAVITDCHVQADINSTKNYTAGLVGYVKETAIANCSYEGTLKSTNQHSAGITSYLSAKSSIENCQVTGTIESRGYVGGIAAMTQNSQDPANPITDCRVNASLTSTNNYAGGIVGQGNQIMLKNCVSDGEVKSSTSYAGGIAGYLSGNNSGMSYCVNKADVTGSRSACGLIGYVGAAMDIVGSYSTGELLATSSTGAANALTYYNAAVTFKDSFMITGKLPENPKAAYENFYVLDGLDSNAKVTDGVKVFHESDLIDGTLTAKLNKESTIWKQGKETPELMQAGILSMHFALEGVAKVYPAAADKEADASGYTWKVTLPIGTDTTKLTKDNLVLDTISAVAEVSVAISEDGRTWTVTAANGEETAVYKILVEVPNAVEVPVITKDLTGGNYYNSTDVKKNRIQYMGVSAVVYDGGELTYQWYVNTKASTKGGTALEGETNALFQPNLADKDGNPLFGRKWYYCVITNTVTNNGTAYQASQTTGLREVNLQCMVTVDDEVGMNDGTYNITCGKKLSTITVTGKPGMTAYWYTDTTATQEVSLDTKITTDRSFYIMWKDTQYKIDLPKSTANYTVTADDPSITTVLYKEEYGFTVTRTNTNEAQFFVKVNGSILEPDADGSNHYTITNIQDDQNIVVEYSEGAKPEADGSYRISNEADLIMLLSSEAGKTAQITLTADIELASDLTFFATKDAAFKGTLNGGGHRVSNLTRPFIGFVAKEGKVENLNFSGTFGYNTYIVTQNDAEICPSGSAYDYKFAAPIAINQGTITRCESDISMQMSCNQGGITAYNMGGTITNCIFRGNLHTNSSGRGDYGAGGIAGVNDGTISACAFFGYIRGDKGGGIVGMNSAHVDNAVVENCYASGTVLTYIVMNTPEYGAIIGKSNPRNVAGGMLAGVKNNYYVSTMANNAGIDKVNGGTAGAATSLAEEQMKSTYMVTRLNGLSEDLLYLVDLNDQNNGYPIFAWQGTPRANAEKVSVSAEGKIQADQKVKAVVKTELADAYTIDWVVKEDGVLSVLENDTTEITLNKKQIGAELLIRYNNLIDGSSMLTSVGVIEASPIKSIYVNTDNVATTNGAIDLIYDDTNEQRGTVNLGIGVIDPESAHLADGYKVTWATDNRSVIKINESNVSFKHDADLPGATSIQAVGVGTATLTAKMDNMEAKVTVVVHPSYVEGISVQIADVTKKTGVLAADLAKAYESWSWKEDAPAKEYVTALHVLAAVVETPAENIKVTNGIVTSVNGKEGNWYYTLNGQFMGAIDAAAEVKAGDEVAFVQADPENAVTTIGMFNEIVYNGFATLPMEIALTEVNTADETYAQTASAGALIKVTDQNGEPVKAIVNGNEKVSEITTGETGKVTVSFDKAATYRVTAEKEGMVTAAANIVMAEKVLVTGITAAPANIRLLTGETQAITTIVAPANATNQEVLYSSSDENVAVVSADGVVTAKGPGSAAITVISKDQPTVMAQVNVTVTQMVTGITLPDSVSVEEGTSVQLNPTVLPENASNKAVTYVSKTPSIASVDANGKVLGITAGKATIEVVAADGSGVKSTVTVTVTAAPKKVTKISLNATSKSVKVKSTYQIKATVSPSDAANKKVTYSSSNTKIATVNSKGLVTAKKVGTAKITVKAADGSGVKAVVTIKVTAPKITLTSGSSTVPLQVKKSTTAIKIKSTDVKGEKITKATSSNTKIATVKVSSNGTLTVTGKKAGTATISVTTTNGGKASAKVKVQTGKVVTSKITLNATKVTLKVKGTSTITVTRNPITATEKITYSSSNTKVATVNSKGVVTAKKKGTATITVKTSNGKKATLKVTVK